MNPSVRLTLNTTPEQQARLLALQQAFAEVCNALSPMVQQTRVWNRVALHHMAYKALRTRFPALGSQMVCNAIYSVSRTCRLVYQTPGSPLHHSRYADRPLPLLRFEDTCPVYFDRHTLSIKDGQASMYTLDGRMRFQLTLSPDDERAFHQRKLHEIVLQRQAGGAFELSFHFGDEPLLPGLMPATEVNAGAATTAAATAAPNPLATPIPMTPPEYVRVQESA